MKLSLQIGDYYKNFYSCLLETVAGTPIQLEMLVLEIDFYKWVLKPFVLTYLEIWI